jgi:1,4-dihydroxy-2-naphthoate octaprenyltransferase
MNIKAWIGAFRLRTLPLAISGILCGSVMAEIWQNWNITILIWAMLTAILLQILSNIANDYGDFVKGTDNDKRVGNTRALQSGAISIQSMRVMIGIFIALSLGAGIRLLWLAFDGIVNLRFILYLLVGLSAILAAVYYTVGKSAYGYSGKGDIAVFVFFGPVAVAGVFLLHTSLYIHDRSILPLALASAGIGLLSTAVLNTNNIRDIENDKLSGKFTLAVKWGEAKAKRYHLLLITTAITCMYACAFISFGWLAIITILCSIPVWQQGLMVLKLAPSAAYNALLKKLSVGTLLISLSIWISSIVQSFSIWMGLI